ncbi:MAG: hypothetical protein ACRDPK_09220 [Carbonactinosporaceae bacterium]
MTAAAARHRRRVALIEGDGVGPELVESAVVVLGDRSDGPMSVRRTAPPDQAAPGVSAPLRLAPGIGRLTGGQPLRRW